MRNSPVKEFKLGKQILRIFADENPESPRNWDNLGTMVCSHKRYNLGNKHNFNFNQYDSWEEAEQALIKEYDAAIVLPLFLFSHSGITIRTTPFNDRWDSGQVGFIFISKEKLRKEYGVKRISKQLLDKAGKFLIGEVEIHDQYLRGDVYMFEVVEVSTCELDKEHEEHIDSCSGFYGDNFSENGITDHLSKEFTEALKAA